MKRNPSVDRAFGEGSDARLAGKSIHCNPYDAETRAQLRRTWADGWSFTGRFWGTETARIVAALPAVVGLR